MKQILIFFVILWPVLNNTFFNDSYIIAGSSGGELAGFFSGGKIIRMDGHRDGNASGNICLAGVTTARLNSPPII